MDKMYNNFSMEDLQKIMKEAIDTIDKPKRKMVLGTGKLGLIKYKEMLYNRKLTQEEIDGIKPGLYRLNSLGNIEYYG
jgi:hypothetical protein